MLAVLRLMLTLFNLSPKNKMPRNPKITQKIREIKMSQKFHTEKVLKSKKMFFSSIKEINRLISKRMTNIYLKGSILKTQTSH